MDIDSDEERHEDRQLMEDQQSMEDQQMEDEEDEGASSRQPYTYGAGGLMAVSERAGLAEYEYGGEDHDQDIEFEWGVDDDGQQDLKKKIRNYILKGEGKKVKKILKTLKDDEVIQVLINYVERKFKSHLDENMDTLYEETLLGNINRRTIEILNILQNMK